MKKIPGSLIVVDIQKDFCPGGALAVREGDTIIPLVNGIMERFSRVIATQDWHPVNHISFASAHAGRKPFEEITVDGIKQALWPDHCVAGSDGAAFHRDLRQDKFSLIIRKGMNEGLDSYSAFLENDKKTFTGLHGYLSVLGPAEVFICGLATDYCVYYSAMDTVHFGFRTSVILDACRGIDVPEGSIKDVLSSMKKKGIRIIHSHEL